MKQYKLKCSHINFWLPEVLLNMKTFQMNNKPNEFNIILMIVMFLLMLLKSKI
jgi:hypothetical protein